MIEHQAGVCHNANCFWLWWDWRRDMNHLCWGRPSQSHRRWAPAHAHNGDVEPCDTPSPDLVAQQKRVPGHAVHHGNIVPRSDESPLLNCYIRGVSLVPDGHEP